MDLQKLLQVLPGNYSLADRELISRAFRVAFNAHKGQKRASGEPYVNHCLAVAIILAELQVPPAVVAAGLLHDTVEDTDITLVDLQADFGEEIAKLVDGVTKLTQLPRVSRGDQHAGSEAKEEAERQIAERRGLPDPEEEAVQMTRSRKYDMVSETLRKTFLAMGEDVNVVLIKLADRLHNMRTLGHMPEHKRRRIAQETLDIFAPLANRLGIWQIKWELEDLAFRYVNPEIYRDIAENLETRRSQREGEMNEIKGKLQKHLTQAGIEADVIARPKHIYSIYKKMVRKGVPFEMVYDIRGVRIIVADIPACYSALGVIHTHWRPIPGEFDDYIAVPKDNFYRSLHTAVMFDDAKTIEIQIRTPEMNQNAEYGIAAHWRYKEGSRRDDDYERHLIWLRSLMEWRKDIDDAREFVDSMKTDVFQDRVYVFTPKGDVIDLPAGSTPIDFAYHVHTDVGHRCRGAKINGKLVSLDYMLKTGDKVEVLAAKRGGPSRDWLNPNLGLIKTQRARSKIRQWFKRQAREQNISQGKDILDKELRRLGLVDVNLDRLAREFEYRSYDQLYESIGCGDLPLGRLINHLTLGGKEGEEEYIITPRAPSETIRAEDDTVSVLGLKGLLTSIGRCCNPAPGDDIVGYITRGRGATIHRRDCPNILRIRDRERLVRVTWGEPKRTYPVPIRVKAYDRNGLMKDVATLISDEGINMTGVNVDVSKNLAVFDLTLEVRDIAELSRVLDRLENLPNVMEAQRVRPG
ncbi:MAG TPA: bifunctional (p)ppGpp synthetase/guanosine-3',5'-bis(diphosphate) 3'-pyrophosphohydrolase [Anaerolineales bacterium]|nr:bifunctional (p)ppGpp synthetase/guanosine-3',5'-bis(diphosphate) 3'-pyrophosphohydrolase [Anaerolineales bacterium]